MARRKRSAAPLDTELKELPNRVRWREWMNRVEAVVFASAKPVSRDILSRVVGAECNLDLLIDDIQAELRSKPYEMVFVGGGYFFRTRIHYADAIHTALEPRVQALSQLEATVLMVIAFFQPITRDQIGWIMGKKVEGKEIDRDLIADLRAEGFIANGPRSAEPGAPIMYVTTKKFLTVFGFASLDDLPDRAKLEAEGLLNKSALLAERRALVLEPEDATPEPADDDQVDETPPSLD